MEIYQNEALSVNVAIRLRELREERNLSMRTLASRSGLSANALSMIERGRSSPAVSTLYKLADALRVPITAFFGPQSNRNQVVFIQSDTRKRVPFQRGIWEGLGGEQFSGRMEPFLITLESGATSGTNRIIHTGDEFVFCIRGTLEYQVESQIFKLKAGDSLLFQANLRHRWRNKGNTVTNAIIVLSNFMENEPPMELHVKDK
jgi:transcriptional regulator with XRE-family HTH domain